MLKFDIESKAGSQVQQVDQAELYLPTESELQMAQVGLFSFLPYSCGDQHCLLNVEKSFK